MKSAMERASEAMARCVAENGGENMAFYLKEAIEEAVNEERERCADFLKAHVKLNARGKPAIMRDMWLSVIVDQMRRG